MKVRELNHIALHVTDVGKSSAFYRSVLRLEPIPRPAFTFPGAWFRLGANQELLGRYLRGPLQPDQRNLLRMLSANRTEHSIAGLRVVSAWARLDGYVEDVSTLASRVGEVSDWDVLLLSVEMEGRIRFEINQAAAQRADLVVSSRLLELSKR